MDKLKTKTQFNGMKKTGMDVVYSFQLLFIYQNFDVVFIAESIMIKWFEFSTIDVVKTEKS